jgi:hypothetical protein
MEDSAFRNQINASGFPFQLRVEAEIKDSFNKHRWYKTGSEYYWKNYQSEAEGFIDLILSKGNSSSTWYMVIECKRVRGGSWVFLCPEDYINNCNDYHLLTRHLSDKSNSLVWVNNIVLPSGPVSSFCTVPGQGDRDNPMLERVCGQLLDSLESLATKEIYGSNSSPNDFERKSYFTPVLITNSDLIVSHFALKEIGLSDGMLADSHGVFQSVPYLRFQKSFATEYSTEKTALNLRESGKEDQRTIFIVNASNITDFLERFDTDY